VLANSAVCWDHVLADPKGRDTWRNPTYCCPIRVLRDKADQIRVPSVTVCHIRGWSSAIRRGQLSPADMTGQRGGVHSIQIFRSYELFHTEYSDVEDICGELRIVGSNIWSNSRCKINALTTLANQRLGSPC
jgi:hypothetical protein